MLKPFSGVIFSISSTPATFGIRHATFVGCLTRYPPAEHEPTIPKLSGCDNEVFQLLYRHGGDSRDLNASSGHSLPRRYASVRFPRLLGEGFVPMDEGFSMSGGVQHVHMEWERPKGPFVLWWDPKIGSARRNRPSGCVFLIPISQRSSSLLVLMNGRLAPRAFRPVPRF
jgi:hypothetical protein